MLNDFKCLKCGNCLFYCPVYNIEKEETFSPRGRLSLIELLQNHDFKKLRKNFLQECLICGSCEKNCSANIKITDIFINNREKFKKDSPEIKKIALYFFKKNFLNLYKRLSLTRYIPLFKLPRLDFKFTQINFKSEKKVILFSGCVANYIITEIKHSAIHVLNKMGYEVITPEFNCCGFPFLSSGDKKRFELLKKENLDILKKYPDIPVIILCPTGLYTFKEYYNFDKIHEFTDFIFKDNKFLEYLNSLNLKDKISIHIPCHYLNFSNSSNNIKMIVEKINGLDIYQPDRQMCCGFGGTFSAAYPKVSTAILSKSIKNLHSEGERKILTNCPGCTLQLSRKSPTLHLAIFLSQIIVKNDDSQDSSTISKE
jgi:glycolate oxidase iron-sulfur subunit